MRPASETPVLHPRQVEQLITGMHTSDGAGVKLTRVLTQSLQQRLDPFLMLDAFGSDNPDEYIAGFPNHPHRGFETITYLIAGRMRHNDSMGHQGILENGGVQWMTAGRGIIHSEIPEQQNGRMEGFQLWLNLPARDKLCAPWYRDIPADELPSFTTGNGVTATVIAGSSHGILGAVQRDITQPLYLDIHLPTDSQFNQPLYADYNAFIYVYQGHIKVGETNIPSQRMAILNNDTHSDGIILTAAQPARVLLIAGQPLNEPIVQHGPFVMNTEQQIRQAVEDFRSGRLGGDA